MEQQHVTFRSPKDLIEKIEEEAKAQRRSRNFIIVEILSKHYAESAAKNGKSKKAGPR